MSLTDKWTVVLTCTSLYSLETNYLYRHVDEYNYIVRVGDRLPDIDWIEENVSKEYIGAFYKAPEAVWFYFKDKHDSEKFKKEYGTQ